MKHVPRCVWNRVDELVAATPGNLQTYTALKVTCLHPSALPALLARLPPVTEVEIAELSVTDIQDCLGFDYILRVSLSTPIGSTVKVFTVLEKEDTRRRIVFAPFAVNAAASQLMGSGFDDQIYLSHGAQQTRYGGAITFDGPAFYTQLGRDLHLRPHVVRTDEYGSYTIFDGDESLDFVFLAPLGPVTALSSVDAEFIVIGEVAYGLFTTTSGCTGSSQMVALSQRIMLALACTVQREIDVVADCYIDNGRLLGSNSELVTTAWASWQHSATACNLRFIQETPFTYHYVFLGISYEAATYRPAPKALRKLEGLLRNTHDGSLLHWSMAEALSLFGFLVHWTSVMGLRPHPYYFVYKFFRRRSGTELSDPASFWPSLLPLLRQWIRSLSRSSASLLQPPTRIHDIFLFTDATLVGWGCVVFAGSSAAAPVAVSAGAFDWEEHINVLEGRAIEYGTAFALEVCPVLRTQPENCRLHYRIDNTSALQQHTHGRARNWQSNAIISRTDAMLPPLLTRTWAYVTSAEQHADTASRLRLNSRSFSYGDS